MQKSVVLLISSLAITAMASQSMNGYLVNEDIAVIAYDISYDAGLSSSYWSILQRLPASPLIPESTEYATTNIKESYGLSIYSYAAVQLYFKFFGGYELIYTFQFIPLNIVPYAQYF